METFAYVLMGSIAVLAVLTVFLGAPLPGGVNQPGVTVPSETAIAASIKNISYFFPGMIGYITQGVSRTKELGSFVVGDPHTEVIRAVPAMEISQNVLPGLFPGKDYIADLPVSEVSSVVNGQITFDIADTNQYGNIVIKWNGAEIYNMDPDMGPHSVTVPKAVLKDENRVIMTATGPGARFWSSTRYMLRNFTVKMLYGPSNVFLFDVFPEELGSWMSGRITFSVAQATGNGNLVTVVNGKEIYSEAPRNSVQVDFKYPETPLHPGQNTLTFKTTAGTRFDLRNAEMRTLLWVNNVEKSSSFVLSKDDYNMLSSGAVRGVIRFRVENALKEGLLAVKLVHGNETVEKRPQITVRGWTSVEFGKNDVAAGNNTLTLSTEGSFDVSEVRVEFQEK